MSTDFPWPTMSWQSVLLLDPDNCDAPVDDRQNLVPGFDTRVLARSRVSVIGAGGLGGRIVCGLAQKGVGRVDVCDFDTVARSNLNRQCFRAADVNQSKALCLAKHAADWGFLGSICVGHDTGFTAETGQQLLSGVSVCVVAVDNNVSRYWASFFCRRLGIPCVQMGIDPTASFGWLMVEEGAGRACVGCVFPRIAEAGGERAPCVAVGAVLDVLLVLDGMALYAIDSLLMERARYWNYRDCHLASGSSDSLVSPRPGCRLCDP